MNQKIKSIQARQILNSRNNPTIEVEIKSEDFSVKAGVPSGASKGKLEAVAIDVEQAINNVNSVIAPQLIGKNPEEQKEIDDFLIELDGTDNKSNLGANAIVGVSMAIARLGAKSKNIPLWKHISQISESEPFIPFACFNIVNGGAHANNDLDIQEFMIVPAHSASRNVAGRPADNLVFAQNFQVAKDVYQALGTILKGDFGNNIEMGDEGGFAPPISSINEAIGLISKAIDFSDHRNEIEFMLDCAASQFQEGDKYLIEGGSLSREELLDVYSGLVAENPIIGLEDPFGESDWQGFKMIFNKLGEKINIIGDDLLVTNPARIREAAEKTACNASIIKVNQIGTVSEAIQAVKLARSFSWKTIVSHRSGETLDDFIADFAVGVGSDFIKSGAPATPFRLAKYNRLLAIEQEIMSSEV